MARPLHGPELSGNKWVLFKNVKLHHRHKITPVLKKETFQKRFENPIN